VTSIAIISLALGVGANTAIFSLINALILRCPSTTRVWPSIRLRSCLDEIPKCPSNMSFQKQNPTRFLASDENHRKFHEGYVPVSNIYSLWNFGSGVSAHDISR
jgi:hypothetical protein